MMNAAKARGLAAKARGLAAARARRGVAAGAGVRGALCARHRLAGLSQAQGAAVLRAAEEEGGRAPGLGAGG